MSDVAAQAEHQHVVCQMIEWASLFGKDAGSPTFSPDVKLYTPDDQELGLRERVVVLRVLTKGPGNVSRGQLNPCTLEPGQFVLANLYNKGFSFDIMGEPVVTFNWENIMAELRVDEAHRDIQIIPLQAFVICRVNEKRAAPIFMGQRATAAGIILPGGDSMKGTPDSINERGRKVEGTKVACEEVVECGPGCVIDGVWQEPNCRPGDMVIYDTSVSPLRVTIQGHSFTLIHWRHVILTVRDGAVVRAAEPESTPDQLKEQAFADAAKAQIH